VHTGPHSHHKERPYKRPSHHAQHPYTTQRATFFTHILTLGSALINQFLAVSIEVSSAISPSGAGGEKKSKGVNVGGSLLPFKNFLKKNLKFFFLLLFVQLRQNSPSTLSPFPSYLPVPSIKKIGYVPHYSGPSSASFSPVSIRWGCV
jgi:hypothetical protein